jgi:hypothetical protein
MARLAQLLAAVVAFAATNAAAANILIQIDKPSQTMTVAVELVASIGGEE